MAMRFATSFFAAVLLCAAQVAAADESFQGALRRASESQYPSQYSFADLYRLAVSGPAVSLPLVAAGEAPIRTAASQPPAQFAVSEAPEPQPALLLLSGLALAIWVARRRLGYAF